MTSRQEEVQGGPCKKLGLPKENRRNPLLALSQLVRKGLRLIEQVLRTSGTAVNLVILGTGDAAIGGNPEEMERAYPGRMKLFFEFDESLAHLIEAGADIFLMPSRYEPCGLNQMYSLRYGTIPVVHATGGLDDSVSDVVREPDSGTGFKFYDYEPEAFFEALKSALDIFGQGPAWMEMQKRAMSQDFSWDRSAREYIQIYEKTLAKRKSDLAKRPDLGKVR